MKAASKKWIKTLIEKNLISPCTEEEVPKSFEYEFYKIKDFDSKKILLAVYKLYHCNCWEIAFQQREGVWHSCGNFEKNDFNSIFGEKESSGWRDDITSLKGNFETPANWVQYLIEKKNTIISCS